MPIDATKPLNLVKSVKADLRANLQAVKDVPAVAFAETTALLTPKANQFLRVNPAGTAIIGEPAGAAGDAATTIYNRGQTGSVTRNVRTALNERVISVKDFGAVGDGVADDTPAFNLALAAIYDVVHPQQIQQPARITGGIIFIPPGMYRIKNWTINKSVTVLGCRDASRLMPTADATPTDYIMIVTRHLTDGNYRSENHLPSFVLQDFMFDGRARSINTNGLKLHFCDHARLESLIFDEIDGKALHLTESVRESTYFDLRFRYCGNTTVPQISIDDEGLTLDGHNNISFIGGGFVYPMGDNVSISSLSPNPVRSIFFTNILIHGRNPNTTPYPRLGPTRHFVIGSCNHVHIANCRIHAWAEGQAAIHIVGPADVLVSNCNFSRAYRDVPDPGPPVQNFIGPDALNPHCRISHASGRIQSCNNYFEQLANSIMVVDRPAGGIHRHFLYSDNPVPPSQSTIA